MNRTRREIEALADIFVGQPPPSRDLPADRVVVLLEGHLPVRGALWRLAAASLVANDDPATLLDVDDRHLHATAMGSSIGEVATLEHLVGGVSGGHLWILAGSEMPTLMSEVSAADELVIVTGANQAAVVGAYRLAKQVLAAAVDGVGVGVVIAGSPQSTAEEVWERLSETLRRHLGVEPRLVGVLPQLDVAGTSERTTVPMPSGGARVLFDCIRTRGGEAPPVTRVAAATADPSAREAPRPEPALAEPPAAQPPSEDAFPGRFAAGPAADDRPVGLPRDLPRDLPRGLQRVAVETPLPASIQVAYDASGCPHLVTGEAGLAVLEAARRWAVSHRPLLAAAVSGIDAGAEVICDLLVTDYHRAASLAGGPWRVHLVHEGGMLEVPPPEPTSFSGF
ncbi:MAG: hypothetical protein QF733_01750 [Phycisphaerales bacterium]|jgi:hypothetical protein|nr:hypothetical protein [Phycisphaerales bacterium]